MAGQAWRPPGVYRLGDTGITIATGQQRTRKRNRLREAMGTGEILRCVYFGGTTAPGTERPIVPLSLDGNDVWVHCLNSDRQKRYKLHRMRLLEDWEDAARVGPPEDYDEWENRRPIAKPVKTLAEVQERHEAELRQSGWIVSLSDKELILTWGAGQAGDLSAKMSLQFDDKREKWVLARSGKRRIWRATLKGASNQLLIFAKREASMHGDQSTHRSETIRNPLKENVGRIGPILAISGALGLGFIIGLWLIN